MAKHQCGPGLGWGGIVEAVTQSVKGDEIHVEPGRYAANTSLRLPAGVRLVGQAGSVVESDGHGPPVILIEGDDIQVLGMSFVARTSFASNPPDQIFIAVRNSRRVTISECEFDGAHSAEAAVISERSLEVEVSKCVARHFVGLRPESNGAITFSSCEGRIHGSSIQGGSRGILIQRMRGREQTPSTAILTENFCHETEASGIVFLSSTGHAEGNTCAGSINAFGISVGRAPDLPDVPSRVTLTGNRCFNNAQAGIAFFSSIGRAENNDCYGARTGSGIVVQHSPDGMGTRPEVTLVGNRCHDNDYAGIVFVSSNGYAERNECWGARRGPGILVQRSSASPDSPRSNVVVVGNRCYENEEAGIAFISCIGRAENNTCWGARISSGIYVGHGDSVAEPPSEVTLLANWCYDNEDAGISFNSGTGVAMNNECCGTRNGPGIAVSLKSGFIDLPFDVVLLSNRCHNNDYSGIVIQSRICRAENNECWGMRTGSGIAVQRDPRFPDVPSNVILVANRCHDIDYAGIAFFSSNGRAEYNECWNARTGSGISVQRDSDFPDVPSDVILVANRCRDNEEAGIAFFSSNGRAESNQCWGSRTRHGISVQRSSISPNAPSEVVLVANVCVRNSMCGIAFDASTGLAERNECWENKYDDIVQSNAQGVTIVDHRILAVSATARTWRQHLAAKLLGEWLIERDPPVPEAEALADFLCSGGCPACFRRFWMAVSTHEPGNEVHVLSTQPNRAVEADAARRLRTYTVRPGDKDNTSIEIRGVCRDDLSVWSKARPPAPGLAALTALLPKFGSRWYRCLSRKKNRDGSRAETPRWLVALVSPDDAGFDGWLQAENERHDDVAADLPEGGALPEVRHVSFDLAGRHGAIPDGTQEGFLERALLDGKTRRQRIIEFLKVVLLGYIPASEAALAAAALSVAVLLALVALTLLNVKDTAGVWELLRSGDMLNFALMARQAVAAQSAENWALMVVLILVAGGFIANRSLPVGLRLPIDLLLDYLQERSPELKSFMKRTDGAKWRRWLDRLSRSESSQRFWIRRRVYGYRLFGWFRRSRPPAMIVAVRNVDVPNAKCIEELRLLMDVCPRDQPVLLITQMPGLSMLVSGFLDVWYPSGGAADATKSQAFIVHDVLGASIAPLAGGQSAEANEKVGRTHAATSTGPSSASSTVPLGRSTNQDAERTEVIRGIGRILGWFEPGTVGGDTLSAEAFRKANVLTHKNWAPEELLATLVIGATPSIHMAIQRDNAAFRQCEGELHKAIEPYLQVFKNPDERLQEHDVRRLDDCAERGDGLLAVDADKRRRRRWVGRVGYRVELARSLRALYRAYEMPGDDGELLLAEMLACGEVYNLHEAAKCIERDAQRAVLHLEAALFLADERLRVAPGYLAPDVIRSAWADIDRRVCTEPCGMPALHRARFCSLVLKARECLRRSGLEVASDNAITRRPLEAEFAEAVVAESFDVAESDSLSLWDGFLHDLRGFLLTLSNRTPAVALKLLEARLAQDWFDLPGNHKSALRDRVARLDTVCFRRMDGARTAEEMLRIADLLRERPALVVAGLGILASADARRQYGQEGDAPKRSATLARVADAMLRLREASGLAEVDFSAPSWYPDQSSPALAAATAVLTIEDHITRLCAALEDGAKSREELATAASDVGCEIEGIALGVHGKLNKLLVDVEDVDERHLISA